MPGRGSTSTNATRTKRAGHGHACRMHMNTPSVYYPVHTRPQQQPEEHQLSTSSSTTELLDLTHARLSLERLWNLSELWTQGNAAFSFAPGSSNMVRDTLSMGNVLLVQLEDRPKEGKQDKRNPDYFANVGDAIRTLREDIPLLFQQDLNCEFVQHCTCGTFVTCEGTVKLPVAPPYISFI